MIHRAGRGMMPRGDGSCPEGEDERTGSHSARYTSPWVPEHIIDTAMLAAVMKAWRAAATGLRGSSLLTDSLNRCGLSPLGGGQRGAVRNRAWPLCSECVADSRCDLRQVAVGGLRFFPFL